MSRALWTASALLQHGADIDALDGGGRSALHRAAAAGEALQIPLFVATELPLEPLRQETTFMPYADRHLMSRSNDRPCHEGFPLASWTRGDRVIQQPAGELDMVQLLLERRAGVGPDAEGNSVLAVAHAHPPVVCALWRAGATTDGRRGPAAEVR